MPELKQLIRDSEVLVYAIGIDGDESASRPRPVQPAAAYRFHFRGRRPDRRRPWPGQPPSGPDGGGGRGGSSQDDHVNAAALREMTDDSGGRTEIVALEPRSRSGDDEHRRRVEQAVLPRLPGHANKDGQWHTIRVEVRDGRYHVRARRGYVASQLA